MVTGKALAQATMAHAGLKENDPVSVKDVATMFAFLLHICNITGWSLRFTHNKRRIGSTNFVKKQVSFSRLHCEHGNAADAYSTLAHEVAHILAGVQHGHDAHWKKYARLLGTPPKSQATMSSDEKNIVPNKLVIGKHYQLEYDNRLVDFKITKINRVNCVCIDSAGVHYSVPKELLANYAQMRR